MAGKHSLALLDETIANLNLLNTIMFVDNTIPTPSKFAELIAGSVLTAQSYKWVGDEGIPCDEFYRFETMKAIEIVFPRLCANYILDVIAALPRYEAIYDRKVRLAHEKDEVDMDPIHRAYAIQGELQNRI